MIVIFPARLFLPRRSLFRCWNLIFVCVQHDVMMAITCHHVTQWPNYSATHTISGLKYVMDFCQFTDDVLSSKRRVIRWKFDRNNEKNTQRCGLRATPIFHIKVTFLSCLNYTMKFHSSPLLFQLTLFIWALVLFFFNSFGLFFDLKIFSEETYAHLTRARESSSFFN